jgi:hypothetical protein
MQVKELVELLLKENQEAIVKAEGCQMCVHGITGVNTYEEEVWITVNAYD